MTPGKDLGSHIRSIWMIRTATWIWTSLGLVGALGSLRQLDSKVSGFGPSSLRFHPRLMEWHVWVGSPGVDCGFSLACLEPTARGLAYEWWGDGSRTGVLWRLPVRHAESAPVPSFCFSSGVFIMLSLLGSRSSKAAQSIARRKMRHWENGSWVPIN